MAHCLAHFTSCTTRWYLASGSADNTIRIWNSTTGKLLKTLRGHTRWVTSLAVLQDGTLASGSNDGIIRIWNTTTGEILKTLRGHTDWVTSLAVLQDGTLASGSHDNTIRIWNLFEPNILDFSVFDTGDGGDECQICLRPITTKRFKLPVCEHIYHLECFVEWWQICPNKDCPLCRRRFNWP